MIEIEDILDYIYMDPSATPCYIIDSNGLDHPIDPYMVPMYIAEKKYTVKIEALEHLLDQYKPRTVHCFISPATASSFPEHTDTCDVCILCMSGTKTINVSGVSHVLQKGDSLYIKQGTPHEATNQYDSIILSIGDE